MNAAATRDDLERFRGVIARRIGLHFDDAKQAFLGDILCRRLGRLGRASDAYLQSLEQEPCGREWSALARELTVGETYFFRNHEQFRALAEIVLPARVAALARSQPRGTLRLLSAGCASGEEAYSLAIVVRETIPEIPIAIRGVDLNPAVLEKAALGRYSSWALRETPPDVLRRWFRADGRTLLLDERIRAAVSFSAGNVATDDPELWPPHAYDVIFCRNLLMYFTPEQMRATVARMVRSLVPGGFLFLGHAETLRGISDAFHLRHTHGTFYYERRTGKSDVNAEPSAQPERSAPLRAPSPTAPALAPDTAWFETIRRATERIARLVPAHDGAPDVAHKPPPNWGLGPARELLRRERFAEALAHVRARPVGHDTEALLLEAALLVHDGQIAAADEACRQLLALNAGNADAHYVLALCREQSGEADRARDEDRIAARLDSAFAMPRLHLGLMARRAGDHDTARREFAQALILLEREEPSRLLLFGGGFKREALMALCEGALHEGGRRS